MRDYIHIGQDERKQMVNGDIEKDRKVKIGCTQELRFTPKTFIVSIMKKQVSQ